jgi:hypothetical protein
MEHRILPEIYKTNFSCNFFLFEEKRARVFENPPSCGIYSSSCTEKGLVQVSFLSHALRSRNFDYPADQMGFYLFTLTGIGIVSKALWRSWNIKKAAERLETGVGTEMLSFHRHFSGLNNEQLKEARMMRKIVKLKAFAFAGLLVIGFTAFVQLKNKHQFNNT